MATQTFVTHNDMQALSQAAVQVQQVGKHFTGARKKSNNTNSLARRGSSYQLCNELWYYDNFSSVAKRAFVWLE